MLKSLLVSMELSVAGRAHGCRHNKNHRVEKGEPRLSIKVDRSHHHYCLACARKFMAASLHRLNELNDSVNALSNGNPQ